MEGKGGLNISPSGLAALLPSNLCSGSGQDLGTPLQFPACTGPFSIQGITWYWQPGPGLAFRLCLLWEDSLKWGSPEGWGLFTSCPFL